LPYRKSSGVYSLPLRKRVSTPKALLFFGIAL
jgi:hypothetical protein